MDDARLMGLFEALTGLGRHANRRVGREHFHPFQNLPHILATEKLHDHVGLGGVGIGAGIEDLNDVL